MHLQGEWGIIEHAQETQRGLTPRRNEEAGRVDFETMGFAGYPEDEEEIDEELEERLMRVAACMSMLPRDEFDEDMFENACYMANVDPEDFSEADLNKLMEMM